MTPIYTATTVRLTARFAGFEGINVDPTTVEVRIKPPAAALVTVSYPTGTTWTHPETGIYSFDLIVDDAGTWQFSFDSGGTLDAYGEGTFLVTDRGF